MTGLEKRGIIFVKDFELKVLVALVLAMILIAVPTECLAKDAKPSRPAKSTIAGNLTGTYVLGTGELTNRLRISQLKNGHIWFFLNAYYKYHDVSGELGANMGDAEGNLPLQGDTMVWKAADGPGQLTFTFSNGKCVIQQTGSAFDCGFGHNVNASGTYKKISSRVLPLKR